ncbi:MAG: metal-dependent transcriptional regulator [Actinomycetota bacterium]
MQVPQGAQDYLEAIYEMEEETARIQQARIAKRLGLSAATVSEQVRRLEKHGLVSIDGREIRLTESGKEIAAGMVRKHRLAERLLTDILEIPWHRAHEEAHAWEHVISPEVEERILAKTGARTCPHGNPIPGQEPLYRREELVTLKELATGERGILALLMEDLELNTEVLKYLEDHKLMPEAEIEVTGIGPDGTLSLKVEGIDASLGPHLAGNLWIRPLREAKVAPGESPEAR